MAAKLLNKTPNSRSDNSTHRQSRDITHPHSLTPVIVVNGIKVSMLYKRENNNKGLLGLSAASFFGSSATNGSRRYIKPKRRIMPAPYNKGFSGCAPWPLNTSNNHAFHQSHE